MKFKLFILLIFISSTSYSMNKLVAKDSSKSKPKTYKEAVNYIYNLISEEDKEYVKNVPFNDLIIFHRGWGMGIRNGLGLWSNNKELLKSCAKEIGKETIHPESASQLIIEGVWKKLNSDLIDFSKLEPENYFKAIHQTIEVSNKKSDNRYMLSLPSWVYKSRQYWDNEERWKALNLEAKNLIAKENELINLATLFLSQNNENLNLIDSILKNNMSSNVNVNILLPEFLVNEQEKTASSKLMSLTSQSFALLCYGNIFHKKFDSVDEYYKWMELRNDNYLMHWKYSNTMTVSDFGRLLKQPRKFLEILILTDKYYDIDIHNSGLVYRYNPYDGVIDNLMDYLDFNDKDFDSYPYDKAIAIRPYNSLDSEYNKNLNRAINMLSQIADNISVSELFEILNPNSIINYNNEIKTDDLIEYKYIVGFLLATQYERIIFHSNKNEAFEILKYYWEKEFISWPMEYYISELLIQIDLDKATRLFYKEFETIPEKGSFTRNAIIKTLIKYDFNSNKNFIYDWYWKIQNKEFRTVPREWSLILTLLNGTSLETKKLYNQIISDSRFSRSEFFKN